MVQAVSLSVGEHHSSMLNGVSNQGLGYLYQTFAHPRQQVPGSGAVLGGNASPDKTLQRIVLEHRWAAPRLHAA